MRRIKSNSLIVASLLLAFPCFAEEFAFQVLRSFGFTNAMGVSPQSRLIEGTDGFLYGTASAQNTEPGRLFRINKNGGGYTLLHHFGNHENNGIAPNGVIEGHDGALYGTTMGSRGGAGIVYRISAGGADFEILYNFTSGGDGPEYPGSALVQGSDGMLYGTTQFGGASGQGTIFRIGTNGTDFKMLWSFGSNAGDGLRPETALIEATDGMLYGTTSAGGAHNEGTLFRLSKTGDDYVVLRSFGQTIHDGKAPRAGLLEASDGKLYGTCERGGADPLQLTAKTTPSFTNDSGTVFHIAKDGSGYQVLYRFGLRTAAQYPRCEVIEGEDGLLYGTVAAGGIGQAQGAVFRMNKTGDDFSLLHSFPLYGDARNPGIALLRASDGLLYGGTSSGGFHEAGAIYRLAPNGSNYALLHSFCRTGGDGGTPQELTLAQDGFLYGTTKGGGTNGAGFGTIFRLRPATKTYETLWHFTGTAFPDGYFAGGVVPGNDGWLYGATAYGGSGDGGTVFKVRTDGTDFTLLHTFRYSTNTGYQPEAALLVASDSRLYGTTAYRSYQETGAIFALDKNGSNYVVLHEFAGDTNGGHCANPLIEASDGLLYGTTMQRSTVFRIGRDGSGFQTLHSFTVGTEGNQPGGRLLEGSDGALYGTTGSGGSNVFGGAVYRMDKNGSNFRILHSFNKPELDASGPGGGLLEGPDGFLYGTTTAGGNGVSYGTLFRLRKDGGDYAIIKSFAPQAGFSPRAPLVAGPAGAFYGTCTSGGDSYLGTIYRFIPVPPLSIRLHHLAGPLGIECSWPATGVQWRLQSSGVLGASANWIWHPTTQSNGVFTAIGNQGSSNGFFRLALEE